MMSLIEVVAQRKVRAHKMFLEVLGSEIKTRMSNMSLDQTIKLIKLASDINPNHSISRKFDERLSSLQEEVLSVSQMMEIGRIYMKSGRERTPVWIMLTEKYLLGRGYLAKLSSEELDEVESWYKQLGFKHS